MPKPSFNDRIDAVFEEIAETLNNPKLRGGFLNGSKEDEILNEIVDIFVHKKDAHLPRVSHTLNPAKIAHVPARVNQDTRKTDRRPRVNHSPNTQKTVHVRARGEPKYEQKLAKMKIPKLITHFSNCTFIYKLFNKNYWRATIVQYS